MVLKLIKSLYGLLNKHLLFFDLKAGHLERGFIRSEIDKGLSMKRNVICVMMQYLLVRIQIP